MTFRMFRIAVYALALWLLSGAIGYSLGAAKERARYPGTEPHRIQMWSVVLGPINLYAAIWPKWGD